MDNTKAEKVKRYVTAIIALSILTIASAVPVAAGIDDEAQNATITPEELIESIAGEWMVEGTYIFYEQNLSITGTRTVIPTSPISANFINDCKAGEQDHYMEGSISWDDELQQVVIQKGEMVDYFNLTEDGYDGSSVYENGMPDAGIMEKVVLGEKLTILNDTTQSIEITAVNMEEVLIMGIYMTITKVSPDFMTYEKVIQSMDGEWTFEGTAAVYNNTMLITGTRTVNPTGPLSAELAFNIDNMNVSIVRSIEWDNETQQIVMQEANETGYYNLTEDGYEGKMVKENGFPEFNIAEKIICKETLSIIDNTMQVLKVNIENMDNETIGAVNITFKPAVSEAGTNLTVEVISGIVPEVSITVATQNVDFGKVYAGTTSGNQTITVINTGKLTTNISAMVQEDDPGFFNESFRLDGMSIYNFTAVIPADQSDFAYEYDIPTNLKVPDWAQGTYSATIFFVTETS
jgi:hypothetical protein